MRTRQFNLHPLESLHRRGIFALAATLILFAACSPQPAFQPSDVPLLEITPTPTTTLATATLTPTEAIFPSLRSPTPEELAYLVDLPAESTPTPQAIQPTEDPYPLCSPLSIHPLEELREIISDPYHPPPPGKEERHQGVDFSYYRRGERTTIQGVGVQSVFPGRVAASIQDKFPYGNMVIIETTPDQLSPELRDMLQIPAGESLYTLYAHMNKPPLVALDDEVEACQAIGEVGKSGNAAEPHLHLEMRLGPSAHSFLSMAYYKAENTPEERAAYVLWRTSWQFRHFDPMTVLSFPLKSP